MEKESKKSTLLQVQCFCRSLYSFFVTFYRRNFYFLRKLWLLQKLSKILIFKKNYNFLSENIYKNIVKLVLHLIAKSYYYI